MKRKTLLIVALVCFGALSLVLSTSAQRQVASPPDARPSAQAAQSPGGQNRAARRQPETRENFDARAGHSNSLDAPPPGFSDAAQTVEPSQQSLSAPQARPAVQYKLQRERPGLQMKWSSLTQTPSRIWSFSESLTPPINADAEVVARGFLKDNTDLFQLGGAEVDNLKVARRYRTDHNGVTHVVLGQQINGIEVFQADLAVHVDRAGAVIAASGELIPGAAGKVNLAQPKMAAAEALRMAAQDVEAQVTGPLNLSAPPAGAEARQKFDGSAGFERDVEARLVYFPLAADQLRLAWEFILWMRETPDVYLMVMDAERGSLLYRYNFTCYDENPLRPHGPVFTKDSPRPNVPYTGNNNPPIVPREDLPFRAAPFNGREIFAVADQHYDWWTGVPANNLISNNTTTYLDRDGTPGQPDQPRLSAPDGNFSTAIDFTQAPTTPDNQRAAQVNLFYWINRYHDILYSFGFNEAAGNFQTNNFNLGGRGADAVLGEAQDGSGTNNANFFTPPDGSPGRVQMYLFTSVTPQLDGDFDQGVIIHELTHGLSNRLVFNASGLSGLQAGGMGEGWSDYFGLVLLRSEADDLNGTYPVGQYVTNNQARGIRRFPYSANPQVFPLTFKDIALRNQVHAIGEIWCNTLLEMRALLIQRYGYQEGQRQSIQLVVDGLKLTPRSPTFVDARNAILLADRVNNRSANQCLLWQAFAKRGLGFWASTTDASDGAPTESLDNAPYCRDAGTVRLDKGNYLTNETMRITLGDRNAAATQRVIVTSSVTGDEEAVTLAQETGIPGSFNGSVRLGSGRARRGDGVLQGSAESADQIVVTYSDTNNGSDPATVRSLAAFAREKALFEDATEIGNQGWLPTGTWAVTNARAASPTRSWTDSPAGNYALNTNNTLTSPLFDLSGLSEVTLNFAHSYAVESGFDFGIVEFSTDDGTTWKRAVAYTGAQADFTSARVRLPGLDGQARARVRFRLSSDVSIVADGWYVDDVRLTGRSVSPVIIPPGGAPSPVITGVTPAFGPPAGGTRVTILGANFTETDDTTVTFDNLPAGSVNVVSGSVITAVAPPHAAGAATVSVRNRQGAVSLVKGFTYYTTGSAGGTPAITSVYPAFGSIRGGTVVTLVGANFTPDTIVLFGSTRGAATFVNANTLRVITPAVPAAATVDVVAGNGVAVGRLTGGFNYINPTPPVAEILSPAGGETFFTGSTINIRWRSSDNRAVARHRLSLRRPSGLGFTLLDLATNIEGSAQSYAWTIPANFAGAEGRLRILVTDDEGTETEVYSDGNIIIARRWEPSTSLPLNSLVFFAAAGDGRYLYALGGRNLATPDAATP
ncbi:MAG: M36 family metallopeptidase, partial [Blastocatellia bacterium]